MYLAVLLTAVQVGGGYVFISSLSKNCRQILKKFLWKGEMFDWHQLNSDAVVM